jgi:hypothetical protein
MKHVKLLITLALACMLAVPAFAMPMVGDNERGDMFGQLDLTEEEMANMTLAELKEMAEEATTEASDRPLFMGDICLLVTDLTVEDVEGMTLAEIEELKESLAEEVDGMTIAEIEELREERAAEMEEMTLAELNEHREVLSLLGLDGLHKNQFGMGGPNGFQGSQGNNFRMAGTCTQQQQCIATGFMNGPGFDTQGPRM